MSNQVFTLDDAIRGIRKRYRFVAICLIGIPAMILLLTLISPKYYTSSTKLFVRLGRENSSMDATATMGENPVVAMPLTREAEINSISEMIQNQALFADVVDELTPELILKKTAPSEDGETEIESPPGIVDRLMAGLIAAGVVNDLPLRERAIIKLQKKVEVEPLDKSNVVLVQYESYDPIVAQMVVECLTKHYLKRHAKLHRNKDAYEFLNTQTSRLKTELNANESEFESLKRDAEVIDLEGEKQVLVNRKAKIISDKLEVDAKIIALKSELVDLEALSSEINRDLVIEETVGAGNEGIDGMRQELYRLEIQRENVLSKYSASHFKAVAIEEQNGKAQKILDSAEGNRKESRRGPNDVFQKNEITLNLKKPELSSLMAKSAAYQSQIDEITRKQKEFIQMETKYLRLQRTINLEDANFRKYVNNLEQAKIDSLLQSENISNISVAQPASFSLKPSSPNKLVNLVMGIAFGAFIGFGFSIYREYRDIMSRGPVRRIGSNSVPLIGMMPSLRPLTPTPESVAIHLGEPSANVDE